MIRPAGIQERTLILTPAKLALVDISMKIRETGNDIILDVYVKPRCKEFKILVEADEIVVHCREEPVGGRVNRELVNELSRRLGRRVELVSGVSSRQKRLLVRDVVKSEVESALRGF